MLKIGRITLDAPFFQASLSGYSDYAMRKLARSFGAPLTFAGVILAESAANPVAVSKQIFTPHDDEHPIGAQILGSDPQIMAKAAKSLVRLGYDLIDLNFACPVPKVLRRHRGGFLLNEPEKVLEIYRQVRQSVSVPVLMKLRTGFDDTPLARDNFWKIASSAIDNGVDALVVHGRSVSQKFTRSADWQILAELKHRFPQAAIVGSGDLFSARTAARCLQTTGIDGVAIARGAIGNPWIFRDLRALFEGKPIPPPPGLDEQGQVILSHLKLVTEIYPQQKAIRYFRKFILGYCKLHPERKKAQMSLLGVDTTAHLLAAVKKWYADGQTNSA